ncbi:putative short-chain dehydrogenase/reductase [Streptomyces roseochromogenus]|nr:putative short-chain dehydrogenase/reductase [Streptomyces roseochromogenus]
MCRTVVVTGATSGLGAVTARELARAGAHVVLAVRDTARGERLAATLTGSVEVRPLDVLVNNAGVMAIPEARTADGFEMRIGTDHLGPFALTSLLLPHLTGRVVTVVDDINSERAYSPWRAYQQSKLANLLFTRELQRRLSESGSPVTAHAVHPGYAATDLQGRSARTAQRLMPAVTNRLMAPSDAMGALPTLYAATQPLPGNSYTGPDGRAELRGHPGPARRSPHAEERLTGVRFRRV